MRRFRCTPETPWSPEKGTPVEHTNVEEVGDQEDSTFGGDIQRYRCKDCGHTWRAELPQ